MYQRKKYILITEDKVGGFLAVTHFIASKQRWIINTWKQISYASAKHGT